MTPVCLATIVEGHGEVSALPVLLRRLHPALHLPKPIRATRGQLLNRQHRERFLRIAAANIHESNQAGATLILFDSDDDCAAHLGPEIRQQSQPGHSYPLSVVLAVREFEAWLLAGLDNNFECGLAETPRDCKQVLKNSYGRYRPTVDQPRLTAKIDLGAAEAHSPSFAYFVRQVKSLIEKAGGGHASG